MTHITNKKVVEYTYLGDTLEDLFENVLEDLRQGKLSEEKLLHFYTIWDDGEYGWIMKAMVSTHENTK